MYIIQKRHNYQEKFHNNYERAAYNNADSIGVRERARYEWANISGEYKRDVSDYIQLCPSCHRKFDMGKITLNQIKNGEL